MIGHTLTNRSVRNADAAWSNGKHGGKRTALCGARTTVHRYRLPNLAVSTARWLALDWCTECRAIVMRRVP